MGLIYPYVGLPIFSAHAASSLNRGFGFYFLKRLTSWSLWVFLDPCVGCRRDRDKGTNQASV